MSSFTDKELEYLNSQKLGRLATLNPDGSPHLTVVSFRYNPELDTIELGGRGMGKSKKYRDADRDGRVAFIVDDVLPPWQVRGVEIRGRAEIVSVSEPLRPGFDLEMIRIHPSHIVGWGIEGEAYQPNSRKVGSLSHLLLSNRRLSLCPTSTMRLTPLPTTFVAAPRSSNPVLASSWAVAWGRWPTM